MEIEEQETNPNADIFNEMQAVRDGEVPAEEPQEAALTEDAGEEAAPVEAPKYRIAGKDFSTQEEAFAYAEEIDRQNAIREAEVNAYRQAALRPHQAAPTPVAVTPEEDNFDEKFYADPKKYLSDLAQQVREQTRQEVLSTVQEQSEDERLWGEFFSENPDLSGDRDIAELVLSKHTEDIKALAQTRGRKAASDYLAQKVRARHQQWADNQKPRRELANTRTGASVGNPQKVTSSKGPEKELNFFDQMRTLNKG